MSFTAGFVIVFVLIARLFLKKSPKILSYALWGVVLFRLVFPFSFESMFSLLPVKINPISQDIVYAPIPTIDTGIPTIDRAVNSSLPAATPAASINPMQVWVFIGTLFWILGIIILLAYSIVSLIKLQKYLKNAVHERDNIYLAEHLETPFVMGIIRPKIYLSASLTAEEKKYVLLHEEMHIRRFDHVIKIFSFFVLCLHWFNPLVWVSFFASGKDMEMSCDEAVIKELGSKVKKEYSASLLTLATGRRIIGSTPLAFGEGDTKDRIKNVLNYKKPTFWIVLVTALLCVVAMFCLASNPTGTTIHNPYVQEYIVGATGILGSVDTEKYTEISKNFAIGADKYGRAVFKNPHKAFETFETLYADAIELIKLENDLKPFSHKNYEMYKVYGIQMEYKKGNPEILAYCAFVSHFLDIYENSFDKTAPNIPYEEPTLKVRDTESSISKVAKGRVFAILEKEDLAKEIVMNSLAMSAAWKGVDIDTLDNYYHIHYHIAEDSPIKDCYAFLLDGKPVLQFGKDGLYVSLNNELYDKLESSFKPLTTDQAVIKALSDTSNRYLGDECFGEGHIILGTEKNDHSTKIYTLTMVGYYGFVNNNFEKISGSGIIPAVVTLKNNNDVTIEYPKDGAYYSSSIKEMFPLKYHSRIFGSNDSDSKDDRKNLTEQERAYAKEYLKKIGRKAEIGDSSDFDHILLTDLGVSVEVSNELEDFYKAHSYYPYFIGTKEIIEDDVRKVYEMSYHEKQKEIKFTKYTYDAKEIVEQFVFNSITGEKIAQ